MPWPLGALVGIKVHHEIEPGCGMVVADVTQIHQVVMNLVTNACHAMRDRGGTLRVAVKAFECSEGRSSIGKIVLKPGGYVELSVSDTGAGMDASTRNKIFDPYFTTMHKGEGTGLGLYIVQGLIQRYGGQIAVLSEVDRGTTFQVFLPVVTP